MSSAKSFTIVHDCAKIGCPQKKPRRGLEQDHPHACIDGRVFLTYTVFDPEAGEEVERVESLPCRRCAEEAEDSGAEHRRARWLVGKANGPVRGPVRGHPGAWRTRNPL